MRGPVTHEAIVAIGTEVVALPAAAGRKLSAALPNLGFALPRLVISQATLQAIQQRAHGLCTDDPV